MYDDIMQKINTDGNWKYLQTDIERIKRNLVAVYRPKQDWEGFKKAIAKTGITTPSLIGLYGNVAYTTYETKDIAYGTELARIAEIETKKEWLQPATEKPPGLTKKQWDQTRAKTYAYYAKTYAMMLHKTGEYKKGLPFTSQLGESTVENLINQRCKGQQHMRWSREGLDPILQIRAAMSSQDWNKIWPTVEASI